MSAVAALHSLAERKTRSCPLPLPEAVRSRGLVDCLVVLGPAIRDARTRVLSGAQELAVEYPTAPFDPTKAEECLAANLAEPLLMMLNRVMVLELNVARLEGRLQGNTPQERFASFLSLLESSDVSDQLLAEYRVMHEQAVARLEKWVSFSLEFLQHLCRDWEQLRESILGEDPGMLTRLDMGAGDTHRNGRSVIIAFFANGKRVVYKPRSLAVDRHFQELLDWLNTRGVEPPFRTFKSVDRSGYGWTEFIPAEPCRSPAEVTRFYERQGSYLAILYALEASDFHYENLIAAGEHPVLIDLEALFHPRLNATDPERADAVADSALGYSVLRVGLLPMRFWSGAASGSLDFSGLGSTAGQLSPMGVPQWEQAGTDQMRLVRKRIELTGAANRPSFEGKEASAFDYVESIASGFATTYRILLSHRAELLQKLDRFRDDEVRVIVRATQTYATLLHESFHPDVLREDEDRSALLGRLHDSEVTQASIHRLFAAEQKDLRNGDIPLFTAKPSSLHVWTSTKDVVENYFTASGLDLVRSRVLQLSEEDLERQLWIVRASVATMVSSVEGPKAGSRRSFRSIDGAAMKQTEMLSTARRIGDRLAELAIDKGSNAAWIGLTPVTDREWQLSPLGLDLYDGLPGVALFLGYLGLITSESSYVNLASAAVATMRRQIEDNKTRGAIGAFDGWSGVIYSLTHLSVVLSDDSLLSTAEMLRDLLPPFVEQDKGLDIISGAAGCALALSALHRCRPSTTTLGLIRACGEHLLQTSQVMDRGIGWVGGGHAGPPLTGFAHGNAGIAYALLAIAKLTGDVRYRKAAGKAIEYERSVFSREHGNWPDFRPQSGSGFATAWCHGAPGIGLSRIMAMEHGSDPFLNDEIEAAIENTIKNGFGSNHSLCHGDLGNIDFLISASEALKQGRWALQANRLATGICETARDGGWICGNPLGVESPGLMTGLAGIGYTFLRLAGPDRIPSVLTLQPVNLS